MWRPMVASLLSAAFVLAVTVIAVAADPRPLPVGGWAAVEQLDCGPGTQVMAVTAELHTGREASSRDPAAALAGFLQRFPSLSPDDFAIVASTDQSVQFVAETKRRRAASALVDGGESGWVVASFAACDPFLEAGRR